MSEYCRKTSKAVIQDKDPNIQTIQLYKQIILRPHGDICLLLSRGWSITIFSQIFSALSNITTFSVWNFITLRGLSHHKTFKKFVAASLELWLYNRVKYPPITRQSHGNGEQSVRRSQRCKLMAGDVYLLISYFVTVILGVGNVGVTSHVTHHTCHVCQFWHHWVCDNVTRVFLCPYKILLIKNNT